MSKQGRTPKVEHFRISLIDDQSHKQLWVMRFSRTGLFVIIISTITVILAVSWSIIAFTPLRTFIPGYPDAHTKRAAINNAIRIDSLQNVIHTWMFYTDNLKKVIAGEDPVRIDSIIRSVSASEKPVAANAAASDSLLREDVRKAEQFGLNQVAERKLPIEGRHFFTPLKGVVSQAQPETSEEDRGQGGCRCPGCPRGKHRFADNRRPSSFRTLVQGRGS